MQLIYVAGCYRSKWGIFGVLLNIWKARQASIRLWRMGYAVFCPHTNTILFPNEDIAGQEILYLQGDLKILKHCQAIYMLKGWQKSMGAQIERKAAQKLGLEIIEE